MTPIGTLGGGNGAATASRGPLVDFTRASLEHIEPGIDKAATLTASQQAIGPFDVPAFGYMRGLHILVEATGGAAGGSNAVAAADAPWNVLREIALRDVNGGNLVGPFTGYDLMLVNKWGGYSFDGDPRRDPAFSAIATSGNFAFHLYVPVEIVARNAFGALPNMNAGATYKLDVTIGASGDVYGTAPNTLPTVRVRAWLDAWTPPTAADPAGNLQAQEPPGLGTTQYWTKTTLNTSVGANTLRLPRVGHYIRNLVVVTRDDNNAREGANVPDPIRLVLDQFDVRNEASLIRRSIMAEQYGYELDPITTAGDDEGVYVYSFSHDFDGKPGGELGHLWLPTSQSSRLELVGSWLNDAGTIDVLTNDVAPVSVAALGR